MLTTTGFILSEFDDSDAPHFHQLNAALQMMKYTGELPFVTSE